MEILEEVAASVEKGDSASVKESVRMAISQNISAEEILENGLIKGMESIGKRFKKNEIFIPEVLIATRAMKAGMDIIRPLLAESGYKTKGRIVIGTVKGDLHDIGKNIVSMMLEREGYEIVDLGIDVPKERFVEIIKKENPDIVGMSALLTTTMSYMREVMIAIDEEGLKSRAKIIIGGAPITQSYADEIKADGYAADAPSAVILVKKLLKT
ncbi:MAG: cobalamin-binding protein [Candidatus Aminicenantes bacterium]|nr:cobalamin-binding protein [Candidatus Aminicenantes bacterium]